MGMIFKISAGVLIGLLIYQIIITPGTDSVQAHHEEQIRKVQDVQNLKMSLTILTNSLHSFYRKNKTIPKFISDIDCINPRHNRQKIDCATVQENGVFYVRYNDNWASAKPYIFDGKLYNDCKTSIPLSYGDDRYRDCSILDSSSIPEKKRPPFDCKKTNYDVEKIICTSDKLIVNDIKLSRIYKILLKKNTGDKKKLIIDDRDNFTNQRRKVCSTSDCIEKMTLKKILRLESLGVWKKT